MLALLHSTGATILSEVASNKGRADIICEAWGHIYIFELKVGDSAEVAIAQIHERNYATPYISGDKKIILIGLTFEDDNLTDFASETLA